MQKPPCFFCRVGFTERCMERITKIVKYREECPNCGAPRTGDMRFCGYCGSTLAIDEQVVEDVSYLADVNRPVDIISTLEPLPVLGKKSNRNLLIAVIVFIAGMAIALWVFPFIFRQNEAEICATVIILFAFLFFVLYRYSEEYYCLKLSYSQSIEAVVLRFEIRAPKDVCVAEEGVCMRTLTVLAEIGGAETCIRMRVSDCVNEDTFPVGSKVSIVGEGNDYVLEWDLDPEWRYSQEAINSRTPD